MAALLAALVVASILAWTLAVLLYCEAQRTARLRRELDATQVPAAAPNARRAV